VCLFYVKKKNSGDIYEDFLFLKKIANSKKIKKIVKFSE
jgi:hypothetical protein